MTKQFEITVKSSGVFLGKYPGADASEAVEALARDAGYKSYRDMCNINDPEDLDTHVEEQRKKLSVVEV